MADSGLRSVTNRRTDSRSDCSSSVRIRLITTSLSLLRADAELLERGFAVHAGVLGQAQHPVPGDVALDLVGAAGDGRAGHGHDRGGHGGELVLDVAVGGPLVPGPVDLARVAALLEGGDL